MPPNMKTIAIPSALHVLLASRAEAEQVTQDTLADTLLRRQIDVAQALRANGEGLAPRYLTDPRIVSVGRDAPTVHISQIVNEDAEALTEAMAIEVGRNVPKVRTIQALLWAELDPLSATADRAPLPNRAANAINYNVPVPLTSALLDLAHRRDTSQEAVIDSLLGVAFQQLESTPDFIHTLTSDTRVISANARNKATIRVARGYDSLLTQVAAAFNGVKSHAVQAILWHGLDQTKDEQPTAIPDRPVYLSGQVYSRLARHLIESRAERGKVKPIREYVENAVTEAINKDERRRKR